MSRTAPAAFLALWNRISSTALQPEYEMWHTFEHVPERVGLPGFREARRYRSLESPNHTPLYFTCYWLDTIDALNGPQYRDMFSHPTAWSARMRSELRDFFRLPCVTGGAYGQSLASRLATVHLRGDARAFAELASHELECRVNQGDLVGAHWGSVTKTDAIPIANRVSLPPVSSTESEFVVMLQGLDAAALREQIRQMLHAFLPVATLASPPEFFELLSQVRQSDLVTPLPSMQGISQRQPARNDLFQKFKTGDKS